MALDDKDAVWLELLVAFVCGLEELAPSPHRFNSVILFSTSFLGLQQMPPH
jgi:hypothetical protein